MSRVVDKNLVNADAKHLSDFMQALLDKVVEVFAEYTMPLPLRQYWTMGSPAVDCEQVVVSFVQMFLGVPGNQEALPWKGSIPRTATVNISISRAVPTVGQNGRPPSSESIEGYAELVAYDSWILMDSIARFDPWENAVPGFGVVGTLEVSEPEGGFQTTVMTLTAAVP
jgi:hypothetical protein